MSEASAFELANGFPTRTNTKRSAPPPGLFDVSASNAGINRADCLDDKQRFQFAFTDVPSEATSIEVWARADGTSCAPPAERKSNCFRVAHWNTGAAQELDNASIVQAMENKASVDSKVDAKELCEKTAHMLPTAVHLHVMAFRDADVVGYSTDADSKPAELDYVTLYDVGGPPAPIGVTLGTGESLLTAHFKAPASPPADFLKYRLFCFRGAKSSDAGTDGGSEAGSAAASSCPSGHPFVPGAFPTSALDAFQCAESSSPSGDVVMDGKQNELPYAVAIAAVDKQGNSGILSEVACDTPRATNSFWDNYRAAGGQAGGHCSLGHASATAGTCVLSVFAVLALLLRRRRLGAFLVALPWICRATPSHAEDKSSIVTIEARFGPYRPRVDRAFADRNPYEKTFGSTPRLMAGAEADVAPLHFSFGSLGFGALVGYTRATAHQGYADGRGVSDEKTTFDLWMFAAVTTLRVDSLAHETPVPLVPYAKLGVTTGLWSSSDRGDTVARSHSNGFFYAVGSMFLLDVLDPQAARTFTVERGVQHSYLFAELTLADLRGFGQSHALRVDDLTWTAGLAFEM
ncbi:MAG: MXAN_2562 family outer membrane beta-barrel protein [Polyangiales bacterium]